jgi:hypothetical protein
MAINLPNKALAIKKKKCNIDVCRIARKGATQMT